MLYLRSGDGREPRLASISQRLLTTLGLPHGRYRKTDPSCELAGKTRFSLGMWSLLSRSSPHIFPIKSRQQIIIGPWPVSGHIKVDKFNGKDIADNKVVRRFIV